MRTIHLKKMRMLEKPPSLGPGFSQMLSENSSDTQLNAQMPAQNQNMVAHPGFRSPRRHDIVFNEKDITPRRKLTEIKWSNIEQRQQNITKLSSETFKQQASDKVLSRYLQKQKDMDAAKREITNVIKSGKSSTTLRNINMIHQ